VGSYTFNAGRCRYLCLWLDGRNKKVKVILCDFKINNENITPHPGSMWAVEVLGVFTLVDGPLRLSWGMWSVFDVHGWNSTNSLSWGPLWFKTSPMSTDDVSLSVTAVSRLDRDSACAMTGSTGILHLPRSTQSFLLYLSCGWRPGVLCLRFFRDQWS
jgi:hypothetical protein